MAGVLIASLGLGDVCLAHETEGKHEENTSHAKGEDSDEARPDRPAYAYGGIGVAAFGVHHMSGQRYDEAGLALAFGGRHAFHDHIAFNLGVTWGLTTWTRTQLAWDAAHSVGHWTKNAYIDVTNWVRDGNEDDRALRGFGAFFAYFGLLFPYFVSGVLYAVGPFLATSHLELNMAASFHLLEVKKGPYVESGASLFAYFHPEFGEMRGGVGPSLGIGYDFGHLGFGLRGMFSPRVLHGEASGIRSDIYTGSLLLRIQ
jgi:hypothetical protein